MFLGKIDFHENKNFSSEERFGKVDHSPKEFLNYKEAWILYLE
jgi:hypothetical protein